MNGTVSLSEGRNSGIGPGTLERALAMLDWIAAQARPCGVREIAAATGINKTSVHRFLDIMRRQGWISQDPLTEKYRLGPVTIQIALAALRNLEFRAVARPFLEELADRTGETSYLGILVGTDVVYVDVILGGHAIVAKRDVGSRMPAYRTAIGKVLLSNLTPEALEKVLLGAYAQPPSPQNRLHLEALMRELEEVRRGGLAHNDEESGAGIYSIAVPVRDFDGTVIAGIGLGGPKERVLPRLQAYSALVKTMMTAVSRELGYPGSDRQESSIES